MHDELPCTTARSDNDQSKTTDLSAPKKQVNQNQDHINTTDVKFAASLGNIAANNDVVNDGSRTNPAVVPRIFIGIKDMHGTTAWCETHGEALRVERGRREAPEDLLEQDSHLVVVAR